LQEEGDNLTVSGLSWHLGEGAKDSPVARMLICGRDPREMKHQLVKANPHRRVLRIESNGCTFFLKQHQATTLAERLGVLLFPSRAKAEWNALHKMRLLGFETPVPVAYAQGKTGEGHTSILVTAAIEDAPNLREALQLLSPDRRLQLAKSLGVQLRVLHDRGIYHRDMQPGNFFVRPAGSGFKFYFLDLHKAVFGANVSARRRARDLAQLVFNLATFCDSEVIDALLAGYSGAEVGRRFARRVKRKAGKLQAARKRSRARRCLKNSSRFAVERVGNLRIYLRRELPKDVVMAALEKYRASGERVVAGPGVPFYIKEIQSAGLYQNFKDLFQRPRGRRAWHAANALTLRGILTPRPLALVEERFAGLLRRSYLITEFVTSPQTLAQYVHEKFVMGNPPSSELQAFSRKLTRAVAALYKESIYHSDLKASNILVRAESGKAPEFYFTDLDGIQLWRKPRPSRVVKNLVQLYCSLPFCVARPLAVRFFLRFLRETGLGPQLRHRLPEIARKAQKRRQRWIEIVRKHGRIL
jgi:tRNA A-37 threonylcarbamoyl transferase component Bud32